MRLKSALRRGVAAAVIAGIVVSSGIPAYAARWDIANGDITVKAGDAEGKNKVSQGETIDKDDTNTVITGESDKNTVTIDTSEGNVDVTFDDLKIDVSGKKEGDGSDDSPVRESNAAVTVKGDHDAAIELDGDNELKSGAGHAGLEHNKTDTSGELTIQDKDNNGSLEAAGGFKGAGIGSAGSNDAQVKITGGNITATSDDWGAGIGSGSYGTGTVEITGGEINATGGYLGAGIGGGKESSGATNIEISGDALVSAGSSGSAAIGSGESSTGETTINIHDTNPEKGVKSAFAYGGAGIGSGRYAKGKTYVTISNASVSTLETPAASTKTSGAGIGTGYGSQSNADITITESTVKAVGGTGAAIGSGSEGDVFSPPTGDPNTFKTIIRITDSNVTASSGPSAAICSGNYSTNANEIHLKVIRIEA